MIRQRKRAELQKELDEGLIAQRETSRTRAAAAGKITQLLLALGMVVAGRLQGVSGSVWLDEEGKRRIEESQE